MHISGIRRLLAIAVVWAGWTGTAGAFQAPDGSPSTSTAQAPPQTDAASSRQQAIERQQAEKLQSLHPYAPDKFERLFRRFDALVAGGPIRWHAFLDSAYAGGGFTLGAGRIIYLGDYSYIDARGSYTIEGYKRAEVELAVPRMVKRRAQLSLIGGWREATQVGFYGLGSDSVKGNRTSYRFKQPYGAGLFTIRPTNQALLLRGGAELTRWSQESGDGPFPSVETRYTPADLPGLGAAVTYGHTQSTVAFDSRASAGYARRGTVMGATLHNYADTDGKFGFRMVQYEAIQHVPILRDAWVLSFRGRIQNAREHDGDQIPFFMLPALGGGSSLRGYSSWRFRDRNSLLLQAEWRVTVNRYADIAIFYDTGKVAPSPGGLDFNGLKDDFGVGLRVHGPLSTPLRVELARCPEGFHFIFSSSAAF